jgi:tetratricopeptide (TPR) repeat protein
MTKAKRVGLAIAATVFILFLGGISFALCVVIGFVQGKNHFLSGQAAMSRFDYRAAIADFNIASEKPMGPLWRSYIFQNRAYCYHRQNQRENALSDYTAALQLNPSLARAYAERGSLLEEMGRRRDALTDYSEALRRDPNDAEVYFRRGILEMREHRYEEARADFREATRCFPDYEAAYLQAGYASRWLNDVDSALSSFEVAINLNPRNAWAYAGRGSIYRSKRDYGRAIADLNEAIRLGLKNDEVFLLRGMTYSNQERNAEAITDLTQALQLNPRNEKALHLRGIVYRNAKDFTKSVIDFTELIKMTQASAAYKERARTFYRSGEYSLAVDDYKKADNVVGGTFTTQVKLLPWLLSTCPDPKFRNGTEAVAMARKDCESTKWKDSGKLDTLAAAYAETGDFQEAIRCEEQAIALRDGEFAWQTRMKERLALYQKSKPYREELEKK